VDWSSIPELIRASTLGVGGIRPIAKGMADAAGGPLRDTPSPGEIALFRHRGTRFQMVSLVASLLPAGMHGGYLGALVGPLVLLGSI